MLGEYYKGKRVLVTGGCGSIGRKIVEELLNYDVEVVKAFDNNETGLFDLDLDLKSPKLKTVVGDVKQIEGLKRVFRDVDIVLHAAAYKHVPSCEYNPMEAVETNVGGTQKVIDAAMACDVEKVILISTDKAVNPVNVMGATKLLAERVMISSNVYSGENGTKFACVRFGNVLNSRGSVIPIFKKQIKKGGPLTITDVDMTRFIMNIHEAARLILNAVSISEGGEIFILKMPAVKVTDIAEVMIEHYAPKYGYKPEDIEIKLIGMRVGEKLNEDLMNPNEIYHAEEIDDLYIIHRDVVEDHLDFIYNSSEIDLLSKEEVLEILKAIDE